MVLQLQYHGYGLGFQKPDIESLLENKTADVLAMLPMNFLFKILKSGWEKEPQSYIFFNKKENDIAQEHFIIFLNTRFHYSPICVI